MLLYKNINMSLLIKLMLVIFQNNKEGILHSVDKCLCFIDFVCFSV